MFNQTKNYHFILTVFLVLLSFTQSVAALNGSYTVNALATASSTNYKNFATIFSDLKSGTRTDGGTPNGAGVTGHVTDNVDTGSGPCTEPTALNQYAGGSATNQNMLNGNGNTFRFNCTISAAIHTILTNDCHQPINFQGRSVYCSQTQSDLKGQLTELLNLCYRWLMGSNRMNTR